MTEVYKIPKVVNRVHMKSNPKDKNQGQSVGPVGCHSGTEKRKDFFTQ